MVKYYKKSNQNVKNKNVFCVNTINSKLKLNKISSKFYHQIIITLIKVMFSVKN